MPPVYRDCHAIEGRARAECVMCSIGGRARGGEERRGRVRVSYGDAVVCGARWERAVVTISLISFINVGP
jgi:hypothetical protein